MSSFLYRRDPSRAAYLPASDTTPPDAGIVAPPPLAPAIPQRATSAVRAAISAFVVAIAPMPDAGTLPIPASAPYRAKATARAAESAYSIVVGYPMDAGTQPTPVFLPVKSRGSFATLANYTWIDTGPNDAGTLQSIVQAIVPDRAPSATRSANAAYEITVPSPGDMGGVIDNFPPIPASTHVRCRGANLSAWQWFGAATSVNSFIEDPFPAFDTFTDAPGIDLGSHLLDTGGTWTKHASFATGGLVLTDANRVRAGVSGQSVYFQSNVSPSANYDVSAVFTCFTNVSTDSPGIVGRLDTASKTFYLALYRNSSGFQLWKFVSGTATQLGTTYALVMSANESHRVTLRMQGTSISLLVDGVIRVGPIVDASVSATGSSGLYDNPSSPGTNSTGTHLDNFNATFSDPAILPSTPDRALSPKPTTSAYSILVPSPADSGVASNDPPANDILPYRNPPARLAASSAYAIVVGYPMDSGTAPTPVFLPDRAPSAQSRLANSTWIDTGPVDAGLPQPVISAITPDRALSAARSANSAYVILVPSPGDSGVAPIAAPVVVVAPDRASPAGRSANANYWIDSGTPNDAGTLPTPIFLPYRARGSISTLANYTWTVSGPADAGLPQPVVPTNLPGTAPASRRTAHLAYSILVPSPGDTGVAPIAEPVVVAAPDQARPAARSANANYWIESVVPLDAGAQPTPVFIPDRAPGAQYRSAAYTLIEPTLLDSPVPPVSPNMPDRSARAARAAWQASLASAPPDAGTQPTPVSMPHRAAGPLLRTSAYALTIGTGSPDPAAPIATAMPDRGRRLPRPGIYACIVRSPRDAGIITIRPIFVDPSAATLLIVADPTLEEVDPSAATLLIVSDPILEDTDPSAATLLTP